MTVTLQTQRVRTLEQVRRVVQGTAPVDFQFTERASAYAFIRRTLEQFRYLARKKAEKGDIKAYLAKMTGFSRAQLTRLIRQYRDSGTIRDRRSDGPARPFPRRYTGPDIRLLAEVDTVLGQRCGPATRAVLRRQFQRFHDPRFRRLAALSNGHLYHLRKSRTYRCRRTVFTKTRAQAAPIGVRCKPQPQGQPGFARVDTVHQGDHNGVKGVYLIHAVDEVTHYEAIGCVPTICERHLVPVLQALLQAWPFAVQGFHTDNGSEYINYRVANLLNKLHIGQFTKSRPRRCNDNALVEGKHAAVVRHYLGYHHIPQRYAPQVNTFTQEVLSPYLNYHRPCLFATEQRNTKGRIQRHYRDRDITTPYEKLQSLPNATRWLKPGITFPALDTVAYACSDLDAARTVNNARKQLFQTIGHHTQHSTT